MIKKKIKCLLSHYKERQKLSPTLTLQECNQKIGTLLCNREASFIGRLGWMEGYAIGKLLVDGEIPHDVRKTLASHAGVFPPTEDQSKRFVDVYLEAMSSVDMMGLMGAPFHGWVIKKYAPQAVCAELESLEPYFAEEPWSQHLKDLKILVIHPFAESIKRQYSTKRDQLFINPKMLPEFQLSVLKTPQTITGNTTEYNSWIETLQALKKQVRQEDFDVAIIGCGAYGFPLGSTVKKMGKMAIHLGGVTQLLFGIGGGRWRIYLPKYKKIMTDAWSSPLESERPIGWDKIENGCYW